jgi:hypothetical protein
MGRMVFVVFHIFAAFIGKTQSIIRSDYESCKMEVVCEMMRGPPLRIFGPLLYELSYPAETARPKARTAYTPAPSDDKSLRDGHDCAAALLRKFTGLAFDEAAEEHWQESGALLKGDPKIADIPIVIQFHLASQPTIQPRGT